MPYHIRDAGIWKEGQAQWVKDAGIWKEVQEGWVKDGGIWKPYYSVSSGWLPTNLTDLRAWYDADDASTITLNGSDVSHWADKSGNGYTVSQSSSVLQPAYDSANSKILFTTINGETLGINSLLGMPNNPDCSFIVFANTTGNLNSDDGINGRMIGLGSATQSTAPVLHGGFGSAGTSWRYNQGYAQFVPTILASTDYLFVWHKPTGGMETGEFRIDGTQIPSSASLSGSLGNFNESYFAIGAANGGGSWINCEVYEVIVLNSSVQTEIEECEGYLAHKWGVTSSLPSGHPYKTDPP